MLNAFRSPWMGYVIPGMVTGLCVWLAYGVISTGIAGYYENNDNGARALRWRRNSPAALALTADSLVRQGNYTAADSTARLALKQSTLRADALRTLALSASAEGRADAALSLMSRAGKLNPRDAQTENWLFENALLRADYSRAVVHADALMRRSPEVWPALSYTLAARLADRAVRAALVQRLAAAPSWRGTFLTMAARYGADADVAALFLALKRTASPATDVEAAPFFGRLVAEAKYRQAKGYFDALVSPPVQPTPLVYDGGFAGLPGPPPLNWEVTAGPGGSASWTLDDGEPSGSLRVSHDGFSSSRALVGQLILLSAGTYQVAARARAEDPTVAGRFKLQITCVNGSRLVLMTLTGVPGYWIPSRAEFTVPPQTCEVQWLQIVPATGDRREVAELSIDDIAIRRAPVVSIPHQESDLAP